MSADAVPASPATPTARSSPSRGRRRRSRSRSRCTSAALFTWPEWAEALAREIERARPPATPTRATTYYRHWLAALERLVADKQLADAGTLARYADAWGRAAERTPHGTPIELAPGDFAVDPSTNGAGGAAAAPATGGA